MAFTFKHLLILAYILTAFLITGTMEFNDYLNRIDTPAGVSITDWYQFKNLERR